MSTLIVLAAFLVFGAFALIVIAVVLSCIKTKPRRRLVARYYSLMAVGIWMVSLALILCWVDVLVTQNEVAWLIGMIAAIIIVFSVGVTALAVSETRKARKDNPREVATGIAGA